MYWYFINKFLFAIFNINTNCIEANITYDEYIIVVNEQLYLCEVTRARTLAQNIHIL